jgi:hypothetical protein
VGSGGASALLVGVHGDQKRRAVALRSDSTLARVATRASVAVLPLGVASNPLKSKRLQRKPKKPKDGRKAVGRLGSIKRD